MPSVWVSHPDTAGGFARPGRVGRGPAARLDLNVCPFSPWGPRRGGDVRVPG